MSSSASVAAYSLSAEEGAVDMTRRGHINILSLRYAAGPVIRKMRSRLGGSKEPSQVKRLELRGQNNIISGTQSAHAHSPSDGAEKPVGDGGDHPVFRMLLVGGLALSQVWFTQGNFEDSGEKGKKGFG